MYKVHSTHISFCLIQQKASSCGEEQLYEMQVNVWTLDNRGAISSRIPVLYMKYPATCSRPATLLSIFFPPFSNLLFSTSSLAAWLCPPFNHGNAFSSLQNLVLYRRSPNQWIYYHVPLTHIMCAVKFCWWIMNYFIYSWSYYLFSSPHRANVINNPLLVTWLCK